MQAFRRLQNHPALLERAYKMTVVTLERMKPLLERIGFERLEGVFEGAERTSKQAIFDCQMCGQCTLHTTGMTCPMTCPKNLRNGPCGGVRQDGNCEIIPDMKCVWFEAWERSEDMMIYTDDIMIIQPPLDRRLEGTSAFINMLDIENRDVPDTWGEIVHHD
ncbi:MAG: methylenetetrahydrofolate reductase C-terminal domain-containing protein [Chloroflexota bacterium]